MSKTKANVKFSSDGSIEIECFPFRTQKGTIDMHTKLYIWRRIPTILDGGKGEFEVSFCIGGRNYTFEQIMALASAMVDLGQAAMLLKHIKDVHATEAVRSEIFALFDIVTEDEKFDFKKERRDEEAESRRKREQHKRQRQEQKDREQAEDKEKEATERKAAAAILKKIGFKKEDTTYDDSWKHKNGMQVVILRRSTHHWAIYNRYKGIMLKTITSKYGGKPRMFSVDGFEGKFAKLCKDLGRDIKG